MRKFVEEHLEKKLSCRLFNMQVTRPTLLHVTRPRPFIVPTLLGVTFLGATIVGVRAAAANGTQFPPIIKAIAGIRDEGAHGDWIKGGFRAKMDAKEAAAILGLKYVSIKEDLLLSLFKIPLMNFC